MPRKKAAISPRKEAQQDRSRQKVEQVLEAALQLLSEKPSHLVNTSIIAERAGVSIGSLYQFFPNKQAIFYELFRRWLKGTLDKLDEVKSNVPADATKAECLEAFLNALTEPKLNSQPNWKLRWAMTSSDELAALEAQHKREVFARIYEFQDRLGGRPPKEIEPEVMLLQNELTIVCLWTLSTLEKSPNRDKIHALCQDLLQVVYDYPSWEKLGAERIPATTAASDDDL
ncbi:MAG: TetR/AcrR family transcriptional regulator [Pseudomonadota bacterium]